MSAFQKVFAAEELEELPEVFAQPEELYIMLLDYVYTDRYNCQTQWDAIVQYCEESGYLVDIKKQLQVVSSTSPLNQFVHAVLLVVISELAQKRYQAAREVAEGVLHDLQTQIQDYMLDKVLRQLYQVSVSAGKLFAKPLKNKAFLLQTARMLASITLEGCHQYSKAAQVLEHAKETDVSFAASYLRLRFNAAFSFGQQYSQLPVDQGKQDLAPVQQLAEEIYLQRRTWPENFFRYDKKLLQYIGRMYQARINSLLNKADEAHSQIVELWQLAPDEEAYEESIAIYLDNFVRYALPKQTEVNLLTPNPLQLFSQFSRPNIVDQAIQAAQELSQQKEHPGVQAVAFYYLGVYQLLKKDLSLALECFLKAKQLNQQMYKYPSEMATLTWLPQMLDFDIAVVQLLSGSPQASAYQKRNFEKLLKEDSVLLKMSPDRQACAMAYQVLLALQLHILQQKPSVDDIIELMARTGLIEERFGSSTQMQYIERGTYNQHLLAQIYASAIRVFRTSGAVDVEADCAQNLKQMCEDFPDLYYVNQKGYVPGLDVAQKAKKEPLPDPFFPEPQTRKELIQRLNSYALQAGPGASKYQQLQIMLKVAQSGMESAFQLVDGAEGSLKELFCVYRGQDLEQIAAASVSRSSIGAQISALAYYRMNDIAGAHGLLQGEIQKAEETKSQSPEDKSRTAQLYHLLGKIYAQQGQYEDACKLLEGALPLLNSSGVSGESVMFDLAHALVRNNQLQKGLELVDGLQTPYAKLFKVGVVLDEFAGKTGFAQVKPMIETVIGQLSSFDLLVIRAVFDLTLLAQQQSDGQDTAQQIKETAAECLAQFSAHRELLANLFQRPQQTAVAFNQFILGDILRTPRCLQPEIPKESIFFTDAQHSQSTARYFASLEMLLALLADDVSSVPADLIESYFAEINAAPFRPECVQIAIVFALATEKQDAVESLLKFLDGEQQQEFIQQTQGEALSLLPADALKIRTFHLNFLQKEYDFDVMVPLLPSEVAPFICDSTYNPLSQFSFEEFVEISLPEEGEAAPQLQDGENCLNNIFIGEFAASQTPPRLAQRIDPGNMFERKQDELRKKRAPSARPCLKLARPDMAKQTKPPRPLRHFK